MSDPATSSPSAAAVDGAAPPRRRGVLDRDRVVAAATSYIDHFGLDRLTMRRLGGELDVEAMALYRYVSGRDDLLNAVADALLDPLVDDQLATHPPDWQSYLRHLAHDVNTVALEHPEVFRLACTRPVPAAWVRPPLRSPRVIESFLTTLSGYGFDDATAATAYRRFATFLFGHLQPVHVAPTDARSSGLSHYPRLQRLTALLAADHDADEPLTALINRIESSVGDSAG